MGWVYIGGHVSGGHYNPIVSLAVALRGKLAMHELPYYMIAQILGGFIAYALTFFIHGSIMIPKPGMGVNLLHAGIVEVLLAFVLTLIVLVVATSEKYKNNTVYGFAIGFIIPALAILGGPISGGLFNPAIAIGSSLFGALKGMHVEFSHLLMYVVGACIGGCLAAWFFKNFVQEK